MKWNNSVYHLNVQLAIQRPNESWTHTLQSHIKGETGRVKFPLPRYNAKSTHLSPHIVSFIQQQNKWFTKKRNRYADEDPYMEELMFCLSVENQGNFQQGLKFIVIPNNCMHDHLRQHLPTSVPVNLQKNNLPVGFSNKSRSNSNRPGHVYNSETCSYGCIFQFASDDVQSFRKQNFLLQLREKSEYPTSPTPNSGGFNFHVNL